MESRSIPMATLAGGARRFRPCLHCFDHVCYSSEDKLTESPSTRHITSAPLTGLSRYMSLRPICGKLESVICQPKIQEKTDLAAHYVQVKKVYVWRCAISGLTPIPFLDLLLQGRLITITLPI